MEARDKVEILLKEYDTLRAEILQRMAHRFAFLGLTGAVGAYAFFAVKQLTIYEKVVFVISAIAFVWTWFQLGNLIARCSKRIAEIEEAVNHLAGEKLLVWEHEKRGSTAFHKAHR